MTTLNSILSKVAETKGSKTPATEPHTKTASAQAQAAPSSIDAAIDRVLGEIGTDKTASETASPIQTLTKLAEQVATIDRDAELKHAQVVGRAMGSGFMAELNDYSKAAADATQQKLAADGVTEEEIALVKMARENPDQFLELVAKNSQQTKLATEQQAALEKFAQENPQEYEKLVKEGYDKTTQTLTKEAKEQFETGYNDAVRDIHKLASEHFAMGFDATMSALREGVK